jgi:drug/metabolite transporter, DME family
VSQPGSESKAAVAFGRRCVLGAAILWSVGGAFAKSLRLDPATIAFYRGLFAGLALLPFVPSRRRAFRPVMVPCGLVFGIMTGLYIAAVKATTAANAILLQFTATFWLIPFSVLFLRERPDRRSVAGIALATVGIAAIVLYGYDGRPGEVRGIALGLASGVTYALVVVGLRGLRALDPIWLSAFNNFAGALTLGAWTWATTGRIAIPPAGPMLALVAFGVVQMAIPYALFARGLREIGAPEAGLITLLEPALNPVWVVLVAGERPAPATLVGGLFLLGGVAIRYWPPRAAEAGVPRTGPAPQGRDGTALEHK